MSKLLNEVESGLKFGTVVKPKRAIAVQAEGDRNYNTWIKITGAGSANASLTFERAGHNHHDELYAYCFKLTSGEEAWFEFPDTTKTEERVQQLKNFLDW